MVIFSYIIFIGEDLYPGPQPVAQSGSNSRNLSALYEVPGPAKRQSRQRNLNTGCCNSLSLRLQGTLQNLQNLHADLETTFIRNQNINGFPTWQSRDGQKAIWHAAKTWCVGDIKDFGSRICQLHSLADASCPSEVSSSNWRYWTGSGFTNVNSGELNILCLLGMS